MINREDLRATLIEQIVRLSEGRHIIKAKMCVTKQMDAQKAWDEKKDMQTVFSAKSIFDTGKSPLMLNVDVWHNFLHLEDAGAMKLSELSTDSLFDLVEYYQSQPTELGKKVTAALKERNLDKRAEILKSDDPHFVLVAVSTVPGVADCRFIAEELGVEYEYDSSWGLFTYYV